MRNLYDLLVEQLQSLYDGNMRQLKFLNYTTKDVESTDLQNSLEEYKRETIRQRHRLERIFILLHEDSVNKPSTGMKALVNESNTLLLCCQNSSIRDAALIMAIQHVNHYQIAGYGTAVAYAKVLEIHEIAQILLDSLRECKIADVELSRIAVEEINRDAKQTEAIIKSY